MARSWTDTEEQAYNRHHERLVRDGLADPEHPEWETTLIRETERQDRVREHAGRSWGHLAYVERPAPRERREHYDENRVRAIQRPRSGNVEVQPRSCPVCGDPTGVRCCEHGRDAA